MQRQIEITEELYDRLGAYAKAFETPAQVIERLLDTAESTLGDSVPPQVSHQPPEARATKSQTSYMGKLEINFYPSDPMAFKAQLLERKEAWIRLHYVNGKGELKHWIARSFSPSSDVLGNLRSGYLRGWREKGIVRADVAIAETDLPKGNGLE